MGLQQAVISDRPPKLLVLVFAGFDGRPKLMTTLLHEQVKLLLGRRRVPQVSITALVELGLEANARRRTDRIPTHEPCEGFLDTLEVPKRAELQFPLGAARPSQHAAEVLFQAAPDPDRDACETLRDARHSHQLILPEQREVRVGRFIPAPLRGLSRVLFTQDVCDDLQPFGNRIQFTVGSTVASAFSWLSGVLTPANGQRGDVTPIFRESCCERFDASLEAEARVA
eukprot:scaffold1661_cov251-Pinguiococcus_pyrenoidosus.AAC.57